MHLCEAVFANRDECFFLNKTFERAYGNVNWGEDPTYSANAPTFRKLSVTMSSEQRTEYIQLAKDMLANHAVRCREKERRPGPFFFRLNNKTSCRSAMVVSFNFIAVKMSWSLVGEWRLYENLD